MTKTPDLTKMMQDMMASFPMESGAFQSAFKNQAEMTEKFSSLALEAAEKTTDISANWTKATLAKLGEFSKPKADISDYSKSMSDFASAAAEMAAENMSAFADVAKKVQMEAVDLLMNAGKDLQENAASVMTKAGTKKAAAAAK